MADPANVRHGQAHILPSGLLFPTEYDAFTNADIPPLLHKFDDLLLRNRKTPTRPSPAIPGADRFRAPRYAQVPAAVLASQEKYQGMKPWDIMKEHWRLAGEKEARRSASKYAQFTPFFSSATPSTLIEVMTMALQAVERVLEHPSFETKAPAIRGQPDFDMGFRVPTPKRPRPLAPPLKKSFFDIFKSSAVRQARQSVQQNAALRFDRAEAEYHRSIRQPHV